ncbi:unnamed protein product, partial [Brassica rapa]
MNRLRHCSLKMIDAKYEQTSIKLQTNPLPNPVIIEKKGLYKKKTITKTPTRNTERETHQ